MITFDRVLPELVRLCESDIDRAKVSRFLVVRDIRGRVRLAVKPNAGATVPTTELERRLRASLGSYLATPVLSTASNNEGGRLATKLFEHYGIHWPTGWPTEYADVLGAGRTALDTPNTWAGVERTLNKDAWLAATAPTPPWPIVPGATPPIMTFHSFKGGVGRTTLVAAYAAYLANRGKRVVAIDLDLEAPGLGALLGVASERGVIDILVDHLATDSIDLSGAEGQPSIDATIDSNLRVFPAGRIDDGYLQKLARLDYSAEQPAGDNPVATALSKMLCSLKNTCDVILIDSRAGLHDLAGISLHGLAHIDVLVFRGTRQNLDGLKQTLRVLGRRATDDPPSMALVETLLPSRDDERRMAHLRTRTSVYDLLLEHVYPDSDPPQPADVGEPHDLLAVPRKEFLEALDTLDRRTAEALRRDDDLAPLYVRLDELAGWVEANEPGGDDADLSPPLPSGAPDGGTS